MSILCPYARRPSLSSNLAKLAERTRLDNRDAEPGWASFQPTEDLYARCKSLLDGGPGSGN